ncbi:hypothetical protein Hypma_012890 [Hypsizygus marmoreus]|uniref:Virilizer N-terminal domain-containing protein n=1 Tax=Hypsizygus marmoreus TaxID=39966 RepID=A0A369JCE1_HYPMA|nr:hypothetical protein Hypma_012890 [Hypsizygus marmoreus]
MLLHWCTVSPEGQSSLAAIRFAAPIRISSIRIFPNGAQPFLNAPDVVARTEPESFFVEVFLNAHTIPHADVKEKARAANSLVPTVMAYPGGQVDFAVDMGAEYVTRLMIVKGKFTVLSVAIYGDVVVEEPPTVKEYEPRPIPHLEPTPLPRAADPSNSSEPITLANQLLDLIPDSPPLSLVVQLMFCLKPSDEEWDLPEFPYIYADMDAPIDEDTDLEQFIQGASKPVRIDTADDTLSAFASRVINCISSPKNTDQAYYIAKLLSISASQHPGVARAYLHHLDINTIFEPQTLDESSLLYLLDAATNVEFARHLNNETFLETLRHLQSSTRTDKPTQTAARRLFSRIRDWECFEDALSNTRGDFNRSWNMLKDIGTEEHSMGIWLESMMLHDDVLTKLAENPVLPTPHSHPRLYFRNSVHIASHDDFITFVRAYIGIASVLAVLAWADSLGNDVGRERALAIIHLWQAVDGYREIVNHLLLLRQLTRRLEWITADNDPPRKSGVLAERILANLAEDPQAVLNSDLVQAILSLKSPLSFIAEHERLSMQKLALVSDDGLSAAVEELMFSSNHPLSLRRLRILRVSLAIVERELASANGEWRTLEALWQQHSPGIVSCLVDILIGVSGDINEHFVLSASPSLNHAVVDQLFRTVDDLLRLITHLAPAFPLTTRAMRRMTIAVADIFACTDLADMTFSQTSAACMAAQGTRQACLDMVRGLSGPDVYVEPGNHGAEIILRTLLQHAGHSNGRDPAYHILQVFTMIDHILPEPNPMYDDGEPAYWVTSVLPNVLDELSSFFFLLDPENKGHFVKRLVRLDDDVIGIGAWLLTEELKSMSKTLDMLTNPPRVPDYQVVLQYQINLSLQFILDLGLPTSSSSSWCINSISNTPEVSRELGTCLSALLDGHYSSAHLPKLATLLAQSANSFDPELGYIIVLTALRASQEGEITPQGLASVVSILKQLPSSFLHPEPLRLEIGQMLSTFAHRELDTPTAESLLSMLEWLPNQDNPKLTTLGGITPDAFSSLIASLLSSLPESKHAAITSLRTSLTVDEDVYFPPSTTVLPTSLILPVHTIEDILRHDIPTPATPPKGTKTPDILGVVISPPTALLRSQATTITGLTKMYTNNDFRELRQAPSARQNTSRLPSMHGAFYYAHSCFAFSFFSIGVENTDVLPVMSCCDV